MVFELLAIGNRKNKYPFKLIKTPSPSLVSSSFSIHHSYSPPLQEALRLLVPCFGILINFASTVKKKRKKMKKMPIFVFYNIVFFLCGQFFCWFCCASKTLQIPNVPPSLSSYGFCNTCWGFHHCLSYNRI